MALLAAAYLGLRLPALLALPLFNDEAVYLVRAQFFPAMVGAPGIAGATLPDGKFLQELALAALALLPVDPLIPARLLSVVCGLATVLALAAMGRALGRPGAGMLAGLLYALSPLAGLHDVLGLPDSMLTLVSALLLWTSVGFATRPAVSRRDALLVGALLAAASLVKLSGLFLFTLPVLAVLLLSTSRSERWRRLSLLRTALIVALLCLAFLAPFHYGSAEQHKLGTHESRILVVQRHTVAAGDGLLRYLPGPLLIAPALALVLRRWRRTALVEPFNRFRPSASPRLSARFSGGVDGGALREARLPPTPACVASAPPAPPAMQVCPDSQAQGGTPVPHAPPSESETFRCAPVGQTPDDRLDPLSDTDRENLLDVSAIEARATGTEGSTPDTARLTGFLLLAGLAVIASFVLIGTTLYSRYLLPAWPPLLLAAALGTTSLWRYGRAPRIAALLALVAAGGWGLIWMGWFATAPLTAPLARQDRGQYLENWTAGHNLEVLLADLRAAAMASGRLTVVNHNQPRLVHLATVLYLRDVPAIRLVEEDLTHPDAPERLANLARVEPTLLVVDQQEVDVFALRERFPRLRLVQRYPHPQGNMAFLLFEQQP